MRVDNVIIVNEDNVRREYSNVLLSLLVREIDSVPRLMFLESVEF